MARKRKPAWLQHWRWIAVAVAILLVGLGSGLYLGQRLSLETHAPRPTVKPPVIATPVAPGERPILGSPAAPAVVPATPPASAGTPAWRKFATPAPDAIGHPLIAIVIDDVGVDKPGAQLAIALAAPITLSFMAYADNLPALVQEARAHGHEIMLHLPMEPNSRRVNPGPNALLTNLDDAELHRRLNWNLDRLSSYVGVNNHMGSRFTAEPVRMRLVLDEIKVRGLFWLDSRTTAQTVGETVAHELNVPTASRDVFLDNDGDVGDVLGQLRRTESIAQKKGGVIAIGHPHAGTMAALRRWIPDVQARGFVLVPASTMIARREGLAAPVGN